MNIEIERKYLVNGDAFKSAATHSVRITQGYLSSVPERTVRVRIKDLEGFLTVKGIGDESGASRFEWERAIPLEDAKDLLTLCEPGIIDKTRYIVEYQKLIFEIDVFYGNNAGLIVAEVELESEDQVFNMPTWLAQEVTGDDKYYNSALIKYPYSLWHDKINIR